VVEVVVMVVVVVVEVLPVLSAFQVPCVTVVLQQNLMVVRVVLLGKRVLLLGKMVLLLHGTTILVVFLAFAAVVKLFHPCLREAHIPVDLFVVVLHVVTFVRHCHLFLGKTMGVVRGKTMVVVRGRTIHILVDPVVVQILLVVLLLLVVVVVVVARAKKQQRHFDTSGRCNLLQVVEPHQSLLTLNHLTQSKKKKTFGWLSRWQNLDDAMVE
jgi:hypothetical protein